MRIVTRGDLDGLTCSVLIGLNEKRDDVLLVHPQDLTEDRVEIRDTDIIANLPYHPNCQMWFDHHMHTAATFTPPSGFRGRFGRAPSAARLVYDYYGATVSMPQYELLVRETDRLDSATLTLDDILNPQGYIKVGFTLDSRSGLGSFEPYFLTLFRLLLDKWPIQKILTHTEVARRCQALDANNANLHEALKAHSTVRDNLVVTDFRQVERVPVGNRFLIFATYPGINVAARIQWGPNREFMVVTLGHSIMNRTCRTNVGELAARYGGGGHQGAASIKLTGDDADEKLELIFEELIENG